MLMSADRNMVSCAGAISNNCIRHLLFFKKDPRNFRWAGRRWVDDDPPLPAKTAGNAHDSLASLSRDSEHVYFKSDLNIIPLFLSYDFTNDTILNHQG